MRVLILETLEGDWEGLYIDGKLIDEGHTLGEGDSRMYILKMAEKHGFKSSDIDIKELSEVDDIETSLSGCLCETLDEYKNKY